MPGRPRKYPIHILGIGDSILLPWLLDPKGSRSTHQQPIHDAIKQEQRRFGKKFKKEYQVYGVLVTRVL